MDAAEVIEPAQIVRLGKEILARLDPDGPEPKDDDPIRPRRFLRLRERVGRTEIYGELDPEAATLLTTVLEPLARRRSVEANGGVPDTRMPDERNADALVEAFHLATTSPDMPTEAGEPVTLTVTIPLAELEQRARQAMLTEPTGMSIEDTPAESLRRQHHPRRTRRPLRSPRYRTQNPDHPHRNPPGIDSARQGLRLPWV